MGAHQALARNFCAMTMLLELVGVGLRFGHVHPLSDVSLRVQAGERVALVGSNGSGKSSLLRVMHGLQPCSRGVVTLAAAARQAMVFQRPWMLRASVLTNVRMGLWLHGQAWRATREPAEKALQRVGLLDLAARSARTLSGGQQQRLALARAWVLQPDILLLDEPTASLDPHAKHEVEQLMQEFAQGADGHPMTLVFASHNLGQVKRLASRVIYLEQGRLLIDLPVQDFFNTAMLASLCPAAHSFVKGESL